jgi:hypothetical protein
MLGWGITLELYQRAHSISVYSIRRADFPSVVLISIFGAWPIFARRTWTTNDLMFRKIEEKLLIIDSGEEIACDGVWLWVSSHTTRGVCEDCFPSNPEDQILLRI